MRSFPVIAIGFVLISSAFFVSATLKVEENPPQKEARPVSVQSIERGKYVVKTSGCNDCHTEGYLLQEGNVPEDQWLMGSSLGWSGPWGTTYARNLRIFMNGLTEDQWVDIAHTLKVMPPMPWWGVREMTDSDLRSIYLLIRSLGPVGEKAPAYLPPGQKPKPPYAEFFFGPPGNSAGVHNTH
jgi:mono/diheme cytochrome c family protein